MLENFKIGYLNNNNTGVTVVLAENGAVGGVSVRGASPATRETDLLKSENTVEKINAVVLSGGSAYGLEASCGVMEFLRERKKGYDAGKFFVPIVVGASIYDLECGKFDYPDKQMGYDCAKNAVVDGFQNGRVGAGRRATVGKILGMIGAKKSGVGYATRKIGGAEVAVISVVNAVGDVYDENGKVVAGTNIFGMKINSEKAIEKLGEFQNLKGKNTTISCVLTNAKFTKTQMNRLCDIAHDGYPLAIKPVHTMYDGDAIFGMASGDVNADFFTVSVALPNLVAKAIRNAVQNGKNEDASKEDDCDKE